MLALSIGGGGEFTAAWTADHNQGGSAFGLRDALFVDPTVTTKKLQIDLAGMTAAVTAILDFNFTTAPPPTVLLDISTQSVPLKNSVKTSPAAVVMLELSPNRISFVPPELSAKQR